jgi:hypothetical protein
MLTTRQKGMAMTMVLPANLDNPQNEMLDRIKTAHYGQAIGNYPALRYGHSHP